MRAAKYIFAMYHAKSQTISTKISKKGQFVDIFVGKVAQGLWPNCIKEMISLKIIKLLIQMFAGVTIVRVKSHNVISFIQLLCHVEIQKLYLVSFHACLSVLLNFPPCIEHSYIHIVHTQKFLIFLSNILRV